MRLLVALAIFLAQSNPEQLFRDAVKAQQHGDDATAIRNYQELVRLRPDVPEVRANLGAVFAKAGHFDEAIEQYKAALAKIDNPALRMNLALAYYKKGSLSDATKLLEPLQRTNRQAALLLADCYVRQNEYAKAIAVVNPLVKAQPSDLAAAYILGSALIRTNNKEAGLKLVEQVAKDGQNAEAYLLAGKTALQLNFFERANEHAQAAFQLNPKLPGLATLRGMVLPYMNDNDGAIKALKEALEADPNDFDANLNLGAVLHTERDDENARPYLEKALKLQPSSTLARYEMARVKRSEGKLEEAVKDLEQVIQEQPKWPQPPVELAALYFRLNRPKDGERERAVFDQLSVKH